MMTIPDRARAYLAKLPAAISGQGGHAATFRAARVLVKDFSLDEPTATELLAEWNLSHCEPPWKHGELRHKIQSAFRADGPAGRLVDSANPRSCASSCSSPSSVASQAADRERLRQSSWPAFTRPTAEEMHAIAALRCLPVDSVDLCVRSGFLRMARVDGHPSFVLVEGGFAQARRLDGRPFARREGGTMKAKNLPGSEGAFIGQTWLGTTAPILLVEGTIALVEAAAVLLMTGRTDWTVLAATSAGSRFQRDPALLRRLAGRRIRIVPDMDTAGLDAAGIWQAELQRAGATVDALPPPQGCKDLGEAVGRGQCAGALGDLLGL